MDSNPLLPKQLKSARSWRNKDVSMIIVINGRNSYIYIQINFDILTVCPLIYFYAEFNRLRDSCNILNVWL